MEPFNASDYLLDRHDPPLAEQAAGDGVAGVSLLLDAERQLALTPALLDGLAQRYAPSRARGR